MQLIAHSTPRPQRLGWFHHLGRMAGLILLILLTESIQVNAHVFSQDISFSGKNVPLEKVFKVINRQTGYLIFCDYSILQDARKVDIDVRNASVETVMDDCLKGQPLTYQIIDRTIVISRKSASTQASVPDAPPPPPVKGKVVNENGEGIPGVTVEVKGTEHAVAADESGNFELTGVEPGSVLVFTSVGYERKEVRVGSQTSLTVVLKRVIANTEEIVVTALGINKEERKIGYSETKVSGDLMNQARETNVGYSLEGRVAGLNVQGVNGGPGSSVNILLRGMASFSSAGPPLFVINGVPIDNSQRGASGEWGGVDNGDGIGNINPDDIESMTVLKGLAASALYGDRAANGVILITTKSGKKGNPTVEYSMNYVVDKAVNNTDFQYQYGQGEDGLKPTDVASAVASGYYSWGAPIDGSTYVGLDGKTHPYVAVKDNIQKFYRTAPTFTNSVSVTNGGDLGSFRLSMTNMDNSSIIRNSGMQRKTINFDGSEKFGTKLNVSVLGDYIDESSTNRPYTGDAPLNANNIYCAATTMNQSILQPGYTASQNGQEIQWNEDPYTTNPWFVVNQLVNNVGRKRFIGSVTAKYNFLSWLYLQGRAGDDVSDDSYFSVTPWGTAYTTNQQGQLNNISQVTTTNLNADALLGIDHDITKDISFNFGAGASIYKFRSVSTGINSGGTPFILPYFYSWSNVQQSFPSYGYTEYQDQSAYYTLDLNYKRILTLSNTGRYDTYSTLPAAAQSLFTPSVSGSFIFSELTHIPWLTYGKLRASYAQGSGEANTPYITEQTYNVGLQLNGATTGSYSSSLPNLFLKPYTLTEEEVGFETKWFENRVGLDFAYFHRLSNHEIISGSISPTTGYSSEYIGTGSTENKGTEWNLTVVPLRNRNFTWTSNINATFVANKIVSVYGKGNNGSLTLGYYRPLNANTAIVQGMPGPQIMAYDYQRNKSGQIMYDNQGLPVKGALKPFGGVLPKVFGGWNNDFTYKGFEFSFLIDGKFGNKVLSGTSYYSIYRGLNKMTLAGRATGVVGQGVGPDSTSTNTINVPAQTYYENLAQRISALNVLNGSFLKLRQVTLGYTFTQKQFGNAPFQSINVSFVARNLFILMKHTPNIDPESSLNPTITYEGIECNSLPATRTYGVNVNIKFKSL